MTYGNVARSSVMDMFLDTLVLPQRTARPQRMGYAYLI
jgi:hypothetical protein